MCYVVPTLGAFVASHAWKKTGDVKIWWLNLMFWGGALFGVIDHWWNGELFYVSENITKDVMLGVVISVAILVVWKVLVKVSQTHPVLSRYTQTTV